MSREHHRARDPEELAGRVRAALMAGTESAGVDVQVEARDGGIVRLHGIVDNLAAREQARQIAAGVSGVQEVVDDITVGFEPGWTDDRVRRELGRRYARDPRTEGVGAEVDGGVVRLMGHVASGDDEQYAVRVAAGIPGITEVRSALKVGEGREEEDAFVARYARRLLAQMGFEPGMFTLWCDDGTLFIRGLVPAEAEARRIERMLRRLDGVREVEAILPVDEAMHVYQGRGGKDVPH